MYYEMIGFSSETPGDPCLEGAPQVNLAEASIFLDFDGTLVDLAATPDAVTLPEDLEQTLAAVARQCAGRLVIVTGRALSSVEPFLGGFDGPIIGGHGAEERVEGQHRQVADVDAAVVGRLGDMAEAFADTHPGLLAERKPTGVVLHFRAAEDQASAAYALLRTLEETHPGFELHHSKMAYELRPANISKDASIARMMQVAPFKGTKPVFFGDDVTDEPALKWVGDNDGIAVKVGEGDTAASLRLPDPKSVRGLLRTWAKA